MNPARPVLGVRDLLVVRNGVPSLDIPELDIYAGETLAVIGPNGSGKTTLLRSLTHLVPFTRGQVIFHEKAVEPGSDIYRYRRRIGLVFQEPILFHSTVYANVASGLRIRGTGKKDTARIAGIQLERFGISHLAGRNAMSLSGGEAQRVNLARAFALEPEVILLDEPFSSLDVRGRDGLMEDLEQALRDTGITAVFTTHDRMEALRLADRMTILSAGRIEQTGTPCQIMENPASEFVAAYTGVEVLLEGTVTSRNRDTFTVRTAGMDIEVSGNAKHGSRVTLGLRPENIMLSTGRAGRISARNAFTGRITRIIPMGYHTRVYIDCGFTLISHVTAHSVEDLSLKEGKPVTAFFKATSVHVIKKDV